MQNQSIAIIPTCISAVDALKSRSRVVLWQCAVSLLMLGLALSAVAGPFVKPDSPLTVSIEIEPLLQSSEYRFNVLVMSGLPEDVEIVMTVAVPDQMLVLSGVTEWQGLLAANESHTLVFSGQIPSGSQQVISANAVAATVSGIRMTAIDSRPLPGQPTIRSSVVAHHDRYEQRFGQTILTISLDH
ncbi:hypothetical protein [Gynuella sp.]|uniref:hypothetical protein n=1 Tax=Gynuella sp. TaxID=2969146 RepID=UPI003D0EA116